MAKLLPKGTRLTRSARSIDTAGKTPAGVWAIVGMATFFVIAGLGIASFMAWKAIAAKTSPSVAVTAGEKAKLRPEATLTPTAQTVESPEPIIADRAPSPEGPADRVEQDQVRQEVLKRIDLMRGLSDADKDKLYVQVERARGFTKIGIVRFTQNGTTPAGAQTEGLVTVLGDPGLRRLLSDPTVILMVVGYADKQGEEAKNAEISRSRAENLVKVLREKTDLANIMHAIGMGGQDLFDQSNLEKNRLVEVWAVQP
jgi:outer membrane protein OmpA-like peptidoglycan-associated protein